MLWVCRFRRVDFYIFRLPIKKNLLYEISIIRPLIIFLLVVYHALCVFTGGWVVPEGVPENAVYWWLGHLISGFRIETIAFVGGYVFCYQCVEVGRRQPLPSFVWKKFKRLIVPCFVFGTLYFFLFRFNPDRFTLRVAFWRVANGIGHLWFLPMLFWCFLLGWCVDRLLGWLRERHAGWFHPVGWMLLAAFARVSLLRLNGLRLGLTRAPYFCFYFYMGYWLRVLSADAKGSVWGYRRCAVLWGGYLFFLLLHLQASNTFLPGCGWHCPGWLCGCPIVVIRLLSLVHTSLGIVALYCTVMEWLRRHRPEGAQPSGRWREASRLCYGVYVFHMFVMNPIYYYSPLPQWCCASALGVWMMPWIVLTVTLGGSVLATWLLLKTGTGRFLIG